MLDIADELNRWVEEGRDFAVATVVAVGGSAPRSPGAALAVDSRGHGHRLGLRRLCGSGGVRPVHPGAPGRRDGARAVRLQRRGRLRGGADLRRGHRGPGHAGDGGRAGPQGVRGGAVGRRRGESRRQLARVARGPAGLLGRALLVHPDGSYEGGLDGPPELDRTAVAETRAMLDAGRTGTFAVSESGSRCAADLTLFVESSVPPPRMIVFGAVDFAAALVRTGKFLGYHVTVCDARPVFATRARFPEADDIVVDWPHRYLQRTGTDGRTVLCVLTHDAKFDIPLLPGGAAAAGRLRRRDGVTPHPRGPQPQTPRSRRHRRRTGPASLADRARPRRPHPRGDGPVHRGRDRRGTAGRHGRSADRLTVTHSPGRGRGRGEQRERGEERGRGRRRDSRRAGGGVSRGLLRWPSVPGPLP